MTCMLLAGRGTETAGVPDRYMSDVINAVAFSFESLRLLEPISHALHLCFRAAIAWCVISSIVLLFP